MTALREVRILQSLHHENIVSLVGICHQKSIFIILLLLTIQIPMLMVIDMNFSCSLSCAIMIWRVSLTASWIFRWKLKKAFQSNS